MNSDLAFLPALEQAKLIRSKEISPLELTEFYLNRIQQFDRELGSYVRISRDRAIADAKAKTERLAQTNGDADLPPFFGVPISIKDLVAVEGIPCSLGVAALRDRVPSYTEGIVERIHQAGFTILGKTATSQAGSLPYTEPPGFPPTRNPWNSDYTPGGSSGGAAAALAAGLCAIAQGSDGGGSIRGPAACCGLVGLKPARGRISHAPVGDRLNGISTKGAIARTVADAAAFLDAVSGYVPGDPYWLNDPEISFLEMTRRPPATLRIAYATEIPGIDAIAPECQQAVLDTVAQLESMGHAVEPGCPDFRDLIEPFTAVWQSGVAATGLPPELLEPMNRWLLDRAVSAGEYLQAVSKMQVVARRIVAFFESFDVLVLPVYAHPPIRVGEWTDLDPEAILAKIVQWIAPSPPFNATGQPAIALPAGFGANGLPRSVQLVGKPAAESTLIALAAQLEAEGQWYRHRPEGFGKNS